MIFLLSRGLMRDFHAVVGIDRIDMLHVWHDFTMSRIIAFQFVRVEPTRFASLAVDQAAEKAHGGFLVPSWLHKDINDVPILIHGSPQILMFPVNGDDGFIQVPGIAQLALPLFQFAGIGGPKLQAPLSDAFIRDENAALSQQLFDFTKAETEAMIEPHGVTDDLGREELLSNVVDRHVS